jgi:hypothetical protein
VATADVHYPGDLSVVGEPVQTLYARFRADRLLVNRRYQRKLVWTVEEKVSFIDSISQKMPVPLVLFAERDGGEFEIIDGLQRLNAIFAYIENEFSIAGGYFDLGTLADTLASRDEGVLEQRTPVLARDACRVIANYIVPSSTYRSPTHEAVDEVFRRINSGGRQLSQQEIRQAGALTNVAEIVRKVAAHIRQDTSLDDVLPLGSMGRISITNRDLPYGISVDDLLWVKQGILTRDQVRESRDEEVVLDLLADLLLDPMAPTGTQYRNAYYGMVPGRSPSAGGRAESLSSHLSVRSVDVVMKAFVTALDAFVATLDEANKSFTQLILDRPSPSIQRYFHAIFRAFLEAAEQDQHVTDYEEMARSLDRLGERMKISKGGVWSVADKQNVFAFVDSVIGRHFASGSTGRIEHAGAGFESVLASAVTEQSAFEIKQGFLRLDQQHDFDEDAFAKAIRTATAIANRGPADPGGYLIYGVADTQQDANRVEQLWGARAACYRGFHVVGTEHELRYLCKSADDFFADLRTRVRGLPVPPEFANELLRRLKPVFYRGGRLVWVFEVVGSAAAVSYDAEFYDRIGPNTEKVPTEGLQGFMRRFFA